MARTEKQLLTKASQQMAAGKFSSALKTAQIGMKSFPKSPGFFNVAGLASAQMGLHKKAADYFARTLAMATDNAETQDNLVQALVLAGDIDKALALSAKFLVGETKRDGQHYLRAMAYLQIRRPDLARLEAKHALDIEPKKTRNLKMLAEAQSSSGYFRDATETYSELTKMVPAEPRFLIEQSNSLVRVGDIPAAQELIATALDRYLDSADMIGHLANLHMMTGDADVAEANYVRLLDLDPYSGVAWFGRAAVAERDGAETLLTQLHKYASQAHLDRHNAALMNFGLGELARKTGNAELEVSALKTANKVEAHHRPYDKRAAQANFLRICTTDFEQVNQSSQLRPIFIVGLPRSGTSLLERMIGVHPDITPLGEFEGGQRVFDAVLATSSLKVSSIELANLYLGERAGDKDTVLFTDKLPANYKVIGPLQAAFPKARFIHLTRNPADTALSTWRTYFAQSGLDYAFDINSMAFEFNLYKQYMQKWNSATDLKIIHVSYEDLVAKPAETTQTIAAFCGLSWSDAMQRPETSGAAILTASAVQARQKVHTRSIGGGAAHSVIREAFLPKLDPSLWNLNED